jgi:hypothetical protein
MIFQSSFRKMEAVIGNKILIVLTLSGGRRAFGRGLLSR